MFDKIKYKIMIHNEKKRVSNLPYGNKKHDVIQKINGEYELSVSKPKSWSGIKFAYGFNKDDVYFAKIEACAENNNSLLEAVLPTSIGEVRITSFVLNNIIKEYQFLFTALVESNSLEFRMSTFGGFSVGKIRIRNIKISNIFPINNSNDLREKIRILGPWFHQLDLNGVKTRDVFKTDGPSTKNGFTKDFTQQDYNDNPWWIWSRFKDSISMDLSGTKVLDIACNCGFYSFELAKCGADVVGIDNSYQDIVRANFAKKVLGIKNVEFKVCSVEELEKEFKSKFDMVLCLGLLYHLKEPQAAINIVSKITDFAIFETIADNSNTSELIMDPTITSDGYLPTVLWLKNAFKQAGFSHVTQITPIDFGRHVFICKK